MMGLDMRRMRAIARRHAIAEPFDLDHVVAGDEQRGVLVLGDLSKAGADAQCDIRIE